MRRRYLIRGTVQGVGFRFFVVRIAARLDVRGWVRNTEDGGVEAVAQGSAEQLDEFGRRVGQGPAASRVTNIQITEIPDEHSTLISFEILE